MKDNTEKSIKDILFDHGFIVTDKKFGGWDSGNRMISDKKGSELGFYPPLEAMKKFCPDVKF